MSRMAPESSVALALPRLIAVTDRRRCAPRSLAEATKTAVERGARGIWLREKDLADQERLELARELAAILEPVNGVLLVGCDGDPLAGIELVGSVEVGIHLSSDAPFRPAEVLRRRGQVCLVGRSCHSLAEVLRAETEGCDYVTVSPVLPSRSKPGYGPPLGLDGLRRVCAATRLPVVALGGIDANSEQACRAAGAASVAMLGAFMDVPCERAWSRSES